MIRALRNIASFTGMSVEQASRLLSENPARLMGWTAKGAIAPGRDADFVFLDENDEVVRTVAQGRTIHQRKA